MDPKPRTMADHCALWVCRDGLGSILREGGALGALTKTPRGKKLPKQSNLRRPAIYGDLGFREGRVVC